MNYISKYENYNPKTKMDAEGFVDNNLVRLIPLYNLDDQDDMTDDEKRDSLVEYFTNHPEQIKRYQTYLFGQTKSLNAPTTNNIGGVYSPFL